MRTGVSPNSSECLLLLKCRYYAMHVLYAIANGNHFCCRIQKVHNVEVCLGYLRNRLQLPSMVSSQSIAEGHREKTLALLWSIIFHFKVVCL